MISDTFCVAARSLFSVPEQLIGLLVAGSGGEAFRRSACVIVIVDVIYFKNDQIYLSVV